MTTTAFGTIGTLISPYDIHVIPKRAVVLFQYRSGPTAPSKFGVTDIESHEEAASSTIEEEDQC